MRRDLSLVRKLEKIEKEMGYCDIKIEKGQRISLQLDFLRLQHQALSDAIRRFEQAKPSETEEGNRLGGMSHLEVYHEVSLDSSSSVAQRVRESFRCVGAYPLLIEEREMIAREIEETEGKMETIDAFLEKRDGLRHERAEALHVLDCGQVEGMRNLSVEFERTEANWNVLTEDLLNLDEALFHVSRAVDYLRSARTFVLTSRSQFRVEQWLRDGYLIDLFKHSTLGRAKEMVEGADRNMKMGLMELICLEDLPIEPEGFQPVLMNFLDALFDDLFMHGKLQVTLDLLEERRILLEELRDRLAVSRDQVFDRQSVHERDRERLFLKMGDARRKLTSSNPRLG